MKKILAYHSIGNSINEPGANLYCVSEAKFRAQMELVRVTLSTIHYPLSTKDSDIIVTFDDGDITNYTKAYPILKELGMKAFFFIIGARVGATGYMDWREIKELYGAGMTIGSHGMSHRILTGLTDKELNYELKESKNVIEDNLKTAVDYFSIPRGFCNEKIATAARNAGYKTVFTSDPKDGDGFKLGRIAVRAGWEMDHFIKVLNNGYLLQDKVGVLVKNALKKILGDRNYDRIRTKILTSQPASCDL